MYTIKINKMIFYSHIGLCSAEKNFGQSLEIDVVVAIRQGFIDDDIEKIIHYGDLYRATATIVNEGKVDLLETLGQLIIQEIKKINVEKICKVTVAIRKLIIPKNGSFASVEIEMAG